MQALEFRKFWGGKATLRQFRDGRIAEVVGEVFLHTSFQSMLEIT